MNFISFKKGAAITFALLLMATAAFPYGAKAQTTSELQAQINQLLAQISGSATGETHTLRTGGTTGGNVETSSTLKTNSSATTADDEGVFKIEFDVTAFEQDVYINKSATRGTTTSTEELTTSSRMVLMTWSPMVQSRLTSRRALQQLVDDTSYVKEKQRRLL